MLNFEYKGISQGKYVEGEIEALNNSEAAYKLKEQKVIITKLIQAKKKKLHKDAAYKQKLDILQKELLIQDFIQKEVADVVLGNAITSLI